MTDAIVVDHCSKWYGRVVGLSDINWRLRGGIVGLLGPNGAGKSTLMKMLAGLIAPSRGKLAVFGASPFTNAEVRGRIGYAPDYDQPWDELTVLELVATLAELAGVPRDRAAAAAQTALEHVGMLSVSGRHVRELSKGMRQRIKLATAIAHDPDLLIFDEPLTGVDPLARVEIVAHIRELAAAGKAICVSSHVLYEIEALTTEIAVIHRGRIVAEGDIGEIRKRLDRRPHRIRIACDRPRAAAAALAPADHVTRVDIDGEAVTVETTNPDRCYDDIAAVVRARGVTVSALTTLDNDLDVVFDSLTSGDHA